MEGPVPFTGNVTDLSNPNGFQWAFRCNRCGNGFESPFEQSLTKRGRGMLRMAGEWFGGPVEKFSQGVEEFNLYGIGAEQGAIKDRAFNRAVEQVKPNFRQCRGCGHWICRQFCWNEAVGQCQECSPLMSEEVARAQGDAQRYQYRERAMRQDWVGKRDIGRSRVRCDTCGAFSEGGTFCGRCGRPLRITVRCRHCGATASERAMYCQNCGVQL